MAENVRSPFDYREPPTLDSDGDGSKPPPQGRVCGRKRKGTPVKVCDRAYVTEDEEEESMSEHSYSPGEGQYPEGAEDRLPTPGSPYYLPDPAQLCVPELGEEGASGVRGPVLFHPPPNCRIREVHCGTQVRLVVIAIRDIAKGEEITVDYSLTDWGENAMEEEAGPHPLSGGGALSRRQHCPYCGRHYRSLARHLEKHHASQPEVRAAMELAQPHSQRSNKAAQRTTDRHQAPRPPAGSNTSQDPITSPPDVDPEEDLDLSGDPAEEKNGALLSPQRHQLSPLLSSLSTLVVYLRRQQHSSFLSLSRSPHSAEAWRLLCHSSLSLLILYNRHRECEVAKLTRLVLCQLPRAGVLGKRGRLQPLILPPHCESCLDLLLQTSPGVGVDPDSPYVFSRPYHSPATPLRGTDLLRNLARSSGAKNPGALTGARVRRQVAILTQLLLLEEGEGGGAKRLEEFLEREYHVTQNCSTLLQDPTLMGRVGRVVLYGEKEGVLFRGMSLQHICLELDVMSGNSADSFSDSEKAPPPSVSPSIASSHKKRCTPPKSGKRGVLKRPWSEAERVAVETHLKRNLMELRVPAKADCERCLELCPLLVSNQRDWRSIKFYVHNRIQLLKKQGRRESAAL
ncbi:Histone-lysine N-methyltransferase H3 lysine-36 specific [Dissostichus eleginoides]|uniref:Histone-lysine N-methyltransferase H3 lysine-36 specific n=1 Tax=Dissostichus eleginoides TaxID=100907 RepID=A0AAD9BV48_DISEL|nr:Histone-lysine N-methyltransferase H3 lysine-36 specific [Dissostichus eleginoides]